MGVSYATESRLIGEMTNHQFSMLSIGISPNTQHLKLNTQHFLLPSFHFIKNRSVKGKESFHKMAE